ncbi:hypothetical protein TNCV_1473301 [Trichonephila clavipes]|nr:hypothetical protein TNCV_1473301 [Trichonephila clavipes]
MTPGMDPQRGLWNCAISTLVQRSSGDKLLGSDLYQEIRLKAKNSFRSRSRPSRGELFIKSHTTKSLWLKHGEAAQTVTKSERFYCAFVGTGKEYDQTLNSDSYC